MPELPDVTVYAERLAALASGHVLERVRLVSPFLLRSTAPPLATAHGRRVVGTRRIGKRLVVALEGDLFLVVHLMVAGRLRWRARGASVSGRGTVAAFDLDHGTVLFTEVAKHKRASLHVVEGEVGLAAFDAGGVDPRTVDDATLAERLAERHTLKRSLTDPRLFDGIGGAYADEILFEARLSPVAWSDRLDDEARARLRAAMRDVLERWTDRLRVEVGDGFPEKVTAFHEGMAVHGRHGQPCLACDAPIQRIVQGDRETNYCPRCQTGGRILADRALSRLLKADWPTNLDELAAMKRW